MSDFEYLTDQQKWILQVKLDAHIEAAVQVARLHQIGLREALRLTMLALQRELSAQGVGRDAAHQMWLATAAEVFPEPPMPAALPLN